MILCATLLYVTACAELFYDQSIPGEIRVEINRILTHEQTHGTTRTHWRMDKTTTTYITWT